jgi:hypothetical protein
LGAEIEAVPGTAQGGLALTLKERKTICDVDVVTTDVGRLLYVENPGEDLHDHSYVMTVNRDLMTEYEQAWKKLINHHARMKEAKAEDDFHQRSLVRECMRDREENVHKLVDLAGGEEIRYALGYMFRRHGAAVYQTRCKSVSVSLRHAAPECTMEIPVTYK